MPPRRASASRSKSRSTSQSPRKSSPRASTRLSGSAPSKSPSLPPPDPAAVQRLIDEAIARAQRNRAANGQAPAAAASTAVAKRPGAVRNALSFLFGSRACTYSPSTTSVLTDVIGAFLVTCITVYFTVAGYLFYRELATGA